MVRPGPGRQADGLYLAAGGTPGIAGDVRLCPDHRLRLTGGLDPPQYGDVERPRLKLNQWALAGAGRGRAGQT